MAGCICYTGKISPWLDYMCNHSDVDGGVSLNVDGTGLKSQNIMRVHVGDVLD